MNLFKEVFKPKNKKEAVVIAVLFIVVGSFVVFEGVALVGMFVSPYPVGEWRDVPRMPGIYFTSLEDSNLYGKAVDVCAEYSFFIMELDYLRGNNIRIELDAKNSVLDLVVAFSGKYVGNDIFTYYNISSEKILELDAMDGFELDVQDYDFIIVKVKNMAKNSVGVLKQLVWVETV